MSIPDSVQDIGSGAFRRCSSMADANGFVVVRRVLYHYAGSAASVTVPSGVQAISSGAFGQNTSITSVSIPSGVQSIGAAVFLRCSNLESVSIQSSVTGIGNKAFANSALATVHVVPGDTTRVSGLIAATKSNLDALAFNEDLKTETVCTVTLDENGGTCDTSSIVCISGQEIGELPVAYKSGYTFTGWYTFKISGGVQLTPDKVVTSSPTYYARFEEKPPEYFKETVAGVEWTYCVVDGKAKISNGDDSAVPTTTSGEVTVPATLGGYPVTLIGDYAFASCSSITKVTIPSGVTGIGNYVFHSASSLRDLFIPKTVTDFTGLTFLTYSIDTIHVEKGDIDRVRTLIEATGYTSFNYDDGSTPPPLPPGYETETVDGIAWIYRVVDGEAEIYNDEDPAISVATAGAITVPSTLGGYPVTRIGDYAFDGCAALTAVTIPYGVKSIGEYAFFECDGLLGMEIPGSVTSIGEWAFGYCDALASVTIPGSVTEIGANAFYECIALTAVEIPDSVTVIEEGVFCNCESLASVKLPTYLTSIGDESFSCCDALTGILIPSTVTSIGEWAFGQSGLQSVEIPGSVKTIGDLAFYDCDELVSVTFGNGVESIGLEAFKTCGKLETVYLPDSVTTIGSCAFCNNEKLVSASVPKALQSQIESGTCFSYCDPGIVIEYREAASVPANDNFADAEAISGASGSVAGSNVGATYEAGEPLYNWKNSEKTVWWTWTAPASGTVTFDTIGSTVDTVMGAYTGDAVASLTTIEQDDDSGGDSKSKISFDAVKDTTYRIAVATHGNGAGGDLTLTWSLSVPTSVIVTFDGNGGDSDEPTRELPSGSAIGALPTAEWSGHTFLGWFTDSAGGDKIDASTTVSGDATYYAHWEEDAPPPDYATILGAPAGMSFASTGDKTWIDGGTIDGKAAVKSGDIGDSQSSTLTATFSGAGTLSFFYKVESEGSYDKLRIYIDGENLDNYSGTVSWTKYEKELSEGSHTVSWEYSKDSSNSTGLDSAWIANVGFESDTTVYTVEFDENGGDSVEFDSVDREAGAEIGALPTAEWSGHTFLGWFTEATGGDQISSTTTVSGNVTYYAHWEEAECKTWTDPETGIKWTYRVVDDKAEIYNEGYAAIPVATAGEIVVPSELGGYAVTAIGESAFDGCSALVGVTIPYGVTTIGGYAFYDCSSLEYVVIPDSVVEIGYCPFEGCTSLADENGFIIFNGVLYNYYGSASAVTIPSGVTCIADDAFYDCDFVANVTIPATVQSFGWSVFNGCTALEGAVIPYGVEELTSYLFANCTSLAEVTIPKTVTDIAGYAFQNCGSLAAVNVAYGDTARVKGLLEASGFDTTGVTFVEASPTCKVTLELNGGFYPGETVLEYEPGSQIGLLPIPPQGPAGLNKFEGWFWNADFVDEVMPTDEVWSDRVCYAKWGASGADILTTVVDGIEWSYFLMGNKVVLYNNGRPVIPDDFKGALTIPAKIAGKAVDMISERAFYGIEGLTSVIIPDSVSDISDKAFAWCTNLEVVQFGKGVVEGKSTIFYRAFYGCRKLKALDFKGTKPPSVVEDAFDLAGTESEYGVPRVYAPKSIKMADWGGGLWMGMQVNNYPYSATITVRVASGKEKYGTAVLSGKDTSIGKKVTLKATVATIDKKKCAFGGWFDVATGERVSRAASYAYTVTGEDKTFEADFETYDYDVASLVISAYDVATADDGSITLYLDGMVSSYSEPKVTVKGLPSGLKYDAKTMSITGKATKPGVYTVTVSATNASEKKAKTAEFLLTVPNFKDDNIWVADSYGPFIPGMPYYETIDAANGCAVSGLPSGMKWTATKITDKTFGDIPANSYYGAATKPGNYTVYFTKTISKVKHTATATFVVGPFPKLAIVTEGATGKDKVTGAGDYPAYKSVSLKATADKDKVFSGYYDGDLLLSRSASYSYVMPFFDMTLTAKFVTATEEAAYGIKSATLSGVAIFDKGHTYEAKTIPCGVYVEWPLDVDSLSYATVKVAGLPSGLKFTAKDIVDSKTKKVIVRANTIYGAPTAASKIDASTGLPKPSAVKITVTTAGKTTANYTVALTVTEMPVGLYGQYDGGSDVSQCTLTVSANGKISGKYLIDGQTCTLSASYFDTYDEMTETYTATLTAKSGNDTVELPLVLWRGTAGGEAQIEGDGGYLLAALNRTDWKGPAWKSVGATFPKNAALEYGATDYAGVAGKVALKFASSGAVTVAGTFGASSASGSAVLVPTSIIEVIDAANKIYAFTADVYVYLPTKRGKFAGYTKKVSVKWTGTKFEFD